MNLPNAAERTVFPKLISVPQLKVRKAVLEVVAQCGQVQKFVFQKVIICIAGSAVDSRS